MRSERHATPDSARAAEHSNTLTIERARQVLVARGVRSTRQRELVFQSLCQSRTHPTAEELFQTVRVADPGISLATIYNTLDLLTRYGLCRRLASAPSTSADGVFRFDADVTDHAHVLLNDGRVRDVPPDLRNRVVGAIPADVVRQLEERLGIRVGRLSIEFIEDPAIPPAPERAD